MKQQNISVGKCVPRLTIAILALAFTLASQLPVYAQVSGQAKYPKVRVILKSGLSIDGTNGSILNQRISFQVNNAPQSYPLDEVQSIMTKKGWAGKWGMGFAGGCGVMGLSMVSEYSEFWSLAVLGVAIFYGIGYAIGAATDSWNIIYAGRQESRLSIPMNFMPTVDTRGTLRLNLVIRFK